MAEKQNLLTCRGLSLPKAALRRLKDMGIFAEPRVSLEHQHLARQYVVRGIESGGAVRETGRYVTFCGPTGEPLQYLYPIDAIGVNGVHAVVIAPILVRVELFRSGRTCQLLITRHEAGKVENGKRPPLENRVVFRGVNGFLDEKPIGEKRPSSSPGLPRFWSRAGEGREIPALFARAVRAATVGSSCYGCSHTHFSVASVAAGTTKS